MSDEMVTLTADSPAAAADFGGMSAALFGSQQFAGADSGTEALTSTIDQADDNSVDVDDLSWLTEEEPSSEDTVRQTIYDALGNGNQPKSVPYERFREVNEQAKQAKTASDNLSQWSDVISMLEQNGYKSGKDVQAALAAQVAAQQENDIRQRYTGMANNNIISHEVADAQAESEILRLKNEQLVNTMSSYMVEQQKAQAYDQFPYARRAESVVESLVQSGINPMQAAEMVHGQISNLAETLIPEIAAMVSRQRNVPTPIDTSSSAQPVISQPAPSRGVNLGSISRLLGIGRNPNTI